jgi:hypothetical protein
MVTTVVKESGKLSIVRRLLRSVQRTATSTRHLFWSISLGMHETEKGQMLSPRLHRTYKSLNHANTSEHLEGDVAARISALCHWPN